MVSFEYAWNMADKSTFRIPSIRQWIGRFVKDGRAWADPFCGTSLIAGLRGDLSRGMDAHDFFKEMANGVLSGVLFDPPYSMEQVKRSYNSVGITAWQDVGNNKSGAFPRVRDEVARCVKKGGLVLSFGWSSAGMGKKRGFEKIAILVVCHGEGHHDTICIAEKKA